MAILTGPEIKRQIGKGNIVIDPFDPKLVGPNSVDLHLGDKLLVYADRRYRKCIVDPIPPYPHAYAIDSRDPPETVEVPLLRADAWLLVPGRVYLGSTREYTETRGFVPYVDGRSSLGRLGVFCHVTAGRGDNGFKGEWTLELVVVEPIVLYQGQRIAQLTFHTVEGPQVLYGATNNTSGRYQGDRGPQPVKIDGSIV